MKIVQVDHLSYGSAGTNHCFLAQCVSPGTLTSWVTSWPKMLWYLGSSHPKLTLETLVLGRYVPGTADVFQVVRWGLGIHSLMIDVFGQVFMVRPSIILDIIYILYPYIYTHTVYISTCIYLQLWNTT